MSLPEFDIVWKPPATQQWVDFLQGKMDTSKPFPFTDWIVSVDGTPMLEVDSTTQLKILPQVMDFLAELRATTIAFSDRRTSADGNNGSASEEVTKKTSSLT